MIKELILNVYPEVSKRQLNSAIKYQEKFNLTLENLKCLNPDCNKMRSWNTGQTKFSYCCSKECKRKCSHILEPIRKTKAKQTYLVKTGFEHNMLNPNSIIKYKQTCLSKYGVENVFQQTSYIMEKRLEKLGYEYPIQNPIIKEKIKQTCLSKYGVENPGESHISNFEHWNDRQFWLDNFITKDNNFDLEKVKLYFNCKQPAAHNQIKKLGIIYTKIGGVSLKEKELIEYLLDLDLEIVTNSRDIIPPLELDIYLPDLNLAIEYNGSYWHSYHETVVTSPKQLDLEYMKYRHQQKSLACIEAGIRLLHIYEYQTEDEFLNTLENFLIYDQTLDTKTNWDLDTGCYPLGISFQVLEPEPNHVLKDRVIWNAGKITTN